MFYIHILLEKVSPEDRIIGLHLKQHRLINLSSHLKLE